MASTPCIDDVSRVASIAGALNGAQAAGLLAKASSFGAAAKNLASTHALLQANGVANLLNDLSRGPMLPGKLAILSQLGTLASNLAKVFGSAAAQNINLVAMRGTAQRLAQSLEALHSRAPSLPGTAQKRIQLSWAGATLGPLGINIFSQQGAATLNSYLRGLQSSGVLSELQAPRVSVPMLNGLHGLATLANHRVGIPGAIPAIAPIGVPAKSVESLLARTGGGISGFFLSGEGRSLIPNAERLLDISGLLAQLRLERALRISLPGGGRAQLPQLTDLTRAFDASGCCRVVRSFAGLRSCADGAARLGALSRGVSAARSSFGVDLRAPEAGRRLGARIAEARNSYANVLASAPRASPAELDHLGRTSQFVSALLQASELGLLRGA